MKETGKMIAWKVKVVFLCQMVQFSKVNFKMESFTVMVYIAGLMDQNMKVRYSCTCVNNCRQNTVYVDRYKLRSLRRKSARWRG